MVPQAHTALLGATGTSTGRRNQLPAISSLPSVAVWAVVLLESKESKPMLERFRIFIHANAWGVAWRLDWAGEGWRGSHMR